VAVFSSESSQESGKAREGYFVREDIFKLELALDQCHQNISILGYPTFRPCPASALGMTWRATGSHYMAMGARWLTAAEDVWEQICDV
jgi:hypothetical protein